MESNLAHQAEPWREELIGGRIVAMAPASINHNRVVVNISRIFGNHLKRRTCEVFSAGAAVYLTEEDDYIPDVMVVCDPEKIRWDGVYGAPDLVAEVLSRGTAKQDRGRKQEIYEKSGVREYWIVNPTDKSVEQYLLEDGCLRLKEVYTVYPEYMLAAMKEAERAAIVTEFQCSLYDDLTISLEDIFYRVP